MYRLCGYHGAHISIRPSIPLSLSFVISLHSVVFQLFLIVMWFICQLFGTFLCFSSRGFVFFGCCLIKLAFTLDLLFYIVVFSCFALTERWQIKIKTWINEWRNLTNEVVSQQGFEGFVNGLNKDDVGHTVHAMTITVTTSQLSERRRSPPPSLKHQIRKYI